MKVMDTTAVINNASLKSGSLRVIFLSRISPIKNLDFLLATLSSINLPIELNIYGPYENETYWVYCQELISNLPQNITVNIHGPIMHSQIQEIFSKYDLFLFPTKGENFGHVIFESLSAGTPVIVSDKTPWRPSSSGGLLSLPLEQVIWRQAIMQRLSYTKEELSELRLDAISYASTYLASDQSIKKNRELFLSVLDDNYKYRLV
jgi:glycosyltransferase involved in cell wall biosynthesis